MTKRVSLIIPSCGDVHALKRLIESLTSIAIHKHSWVEIIIVDNTQTEPAHQSLLKLVGSYPFITLVREERRGKAYAVNTAIKHAHGEFVAFMDDDTVAIIPDHLQQMLEIFDTYPKVAYVSGKVALANNENDSAQLWEKKGGLSKGETQRYWSRDFLESPEFKVKAWQFNKMCAGANSMIRRSVFSEIGPFHILLEGDFGFSAGATIEIGYRIAHAGYELYYQPEAVVGHFHPESGQVINKKLFSYGQADTAYQMSNFLGYDDLRCLLWSLLGHPWYTLSTKTLPSITGKYPLTPMQTLRGLAGNLLGPYHYLYVYYLKHGKQTLTKYRQNWSIHG